MKLNISVSSLSIADKLQQINTAFVESHSKFGYGNTPESINIGNCMVWAYVAFKYIPDAKICVARKASAESYFGGHVFLKIKNKYYDAENLDGVSDWKNLKFIKRNSKKKQAYSVSYPEESEFKKVWLDGLRLRDIKTILARL